ncbi:MAG: hypothetical protein JXJ22_06465 [Bacteroidales bacterium]|nr:hypothetical protein [Bacteroidales bacterium]
MYDPTLGRWHTMDPVAEWDFKTSPYAYVGNDPINYLDPNGMWRTKEERQKDREERRNARAENRINRWIIKDKVKRLFNMKEVVCTAKSPDKTPDKTTDSQGGGYYLVTEGDAPSPTTTKSKSEPTMMFIDDILAAFGNTGRTQIPFDPTKFNAINKLIRTACSIIKTYVKKNITTDKKILEENTGNGVNQPIIMIDQKIFKEASIHNYINGSNDSTGTIIKKFSNDSTEIVEFIVGGDTLSRYGYKEK